VAVGWCATLTTTFRSRVPRICVDEVPAPRFPRPTTVRQGRTGGYNVVKSTSDAHICDKVWSWRRDRCHRQRRTQVNSSTLNTAFYEPAEVRSHQSDQVPNIFQ
jgi:hypothetical protein